MSVASSPRLTRPTVRLRAAVKRNHLDAIGRVNVLGAKFANQAQPIKNELRRLIAAKEPDVVRQGQQLFQALAAKFADQVAADARRQALLAFQNVRRALNAVKLTPNPVLVNPPAPLLAAIVPPVDKRKDHMEFVVLLGLFMTGMALARAGNRAGLVSAETAVDKLAGKYKLAARNQGLWTSNRAVQVAVETGLNRTPVPTNRAVLPLARRVQAEPSLPLAWRAPIGPQPQPGILFPPVGKRGPRGPFPGEPELVILPKPTPIIPAEIPTRDPDPLPPFPPSQNLLGWQVLSVLFPTTRPKHRHRHGDIFYYNPRPERNEMGMDECPNPPYESPKDGGVIAWGCLCSIAPVFGGNA